MKIFTFRAVSTNFCGIDEIIEIEAETLADAEREADDIAQQIFAYDLTLEEEEEG